MFHMTRSRITVAMELDQEELQKLRALGYVR